MSNNKTCPFCGSDDLDTEQHWYDDDGEYDAIECNRCKGAAPADVWNKRAPCGLPDSIEHVLNSGGGVYRP